MRTQLLRRDFISGISAAAFAASYWPGSRLIGAIAPTIAEGLPEMEMGPSLIAPDLLRTETGPFRRAVLTGDMNAVAQAIARDPALIYARDAQGQSVYLLAAFAGQAEVMNYFESKGLVPDVYEAAAGGKVARAVELIRPAPGLVNQPNPVGDTPLHVAAICGKSDVVDNLITFGPNFAAKNPKRKNSIAAYWGLQCVEKSAAEAMAFAMVGNGLDPNVATSEGETLLHAAARSGYPRVIRLLLQKGGDASARNSAGQTPLEIAVSGGKTDAASLLRNSGAIPRDYYAKRYEYDSKFNALTRDDSQGLPRDLVNGFTVISHFDFERVKKFIALCPDLLNTRAAWDELPVEAAAHMGRADIGGHYLDRGASYSLCTATVFGSMADVKRLLMVDSMRLHERGAHSFPLLWYTAFGKPQIDKAEYLIAAGADPKEDMRGRTVLHTAATGGHLEMCRFFLEKGLDPRQKSESFLGVQDAVEAAELAKHPDVASMLREWIAGHPS